MNLPNVKEQLEFLIGPGMPRIDLDERDAIKIGIHAVDFVLTVRAGSEGKFPPLLPGETEE